MKNPNEEIIFETECTSVDFVIDELKKLVSTGKFPKDLGDQRVEYLEKMAERSVKLKQFKDGNLSEEEYSAFLRKKQTTAEDIKKQEAFFKFIVENKDYVLKVLSIDEKTFRQSRELIDNKLDRAAKSNNQLSLFDAEKNLASQPQGAQPIIKGLDLTPAEDRLIHTLSLLLSRKSERYDQSSSSYYMGNHERGLYSMKDLDIEVETARIVIKPHELYSAYYGRDDYGSDSINSVLKTLDELSKKNFMVSLTFPSKIKEGRYDKIRTYLPMFKIAILNLDLTVSESQHIDNNELLAEGKKCHFLFKFGPLFTNNIRERYVEFPEDIHNRILKIGGKNIPQCVYLMRDLLFREKQQKRFEFERDEETLIQTLGLSDEFKAGRKSRVQKRLDKSFDIFKEMGLLKGVEKTTGKRGQAKYQFEINKDFK